MPLKGSGIRKFSGAVNRQMETRHHIRVAGRPRAVVYFWQTWIDLGQLVPGKLQPRKKVLKAIRSVRNISTLAPLVPGFFVSNSPFRRMLLGGRDEQFNCRGYARVARNQ